jgi:hypothetical protein
MDPFHQRFHTILLLSDRRRTSHDFARRKIPTLFPDPLKNPQRLPGMALIAFSVMMMSDLVFWSTKTCRSRTDLWLMV